ncbi:MAG TPA: L-lactate permease [Planctomycetota bacterium]|nr:L-lactate permease [Planctomycetota bacterium]
MLTPLLASADAWRQVYEPHGWHWLASALVAGLPVVALLLALTALKQSAPRAAAIGAVSAILVATLFVGMPWGMAILSFLLGAANGLLPIGWIVFSAMFLYQIAVDTGKFEIMKASIARLTADRRLQALMIAFSFGAIMEGAAGFGTPVAISAALLVGLGFRPFPAAVLCLIANTAPVAWGSIGTPIRVLAQVSGLRLNDLSAMNGRILPFMSVLVPLWLVRAMVPWKETFQVLPAILVSGLSFAITQFVWSNWIDVGLVDIIAGAVSLIGTAVFLKFWKPAIPWRYPEEKEAAESVSHAPGEVFKAWLPFIILFVFVVGWGVMRTRESIAIDKQPWANIKIPIAGLDKQVVRVPPVEPEPKAESAVYELKWFSATGTGVLFACVVTALFLGHSPRDFGRSFLSTCRRMLMPLLAIVPMLGLAYITRYSGTDAILGLAFTRTGALYPFFGTFLGWLGVALTGSDTASNALFGSLQRITSEQLKIDPVLMCSANSAGGVMGKMVDAQSIVVAATAANLNGQEGAILLKVLWHSIAMTAIVGVIVLVYAYLVPTLVPHGVKLFGGG